MTLYPGRVLLIGALVSLAAVAAQAHEKTAIDQSTQIIVVTTADWSAVTGTMQRFERSKPEKKWKAVGSPVEVVVGKKGLGWGDGVVPTDSPKLRSAGDPVKHEGDQKAPAGVFSLPAIFGYAAEKQAAWKMPYIPLTPSMECVDDAKSSEYNRIVDRSTVAAPDWNSSEHMRRDDQLYTWGIYVDHNAKPPKPGDGSCIFLHVWKGPGQGTVGCTAMPQEQIEAVLGWLDPAKDPLLVQMPASEYQRARRLWKLPRLVKK